MAKMKKYKHLFFDLDHTLWDFETNSKETLLELYSKYNLSEKLSGSQEDFLKTYFRINDEKWDLYRDGLIDKKRLRKERFMETFQNFGLEDEAFSYQFEVEYIDQCPHKTGLIPYTLEVLEVLYSKYELHIITNGFSEIQDIKLSKSGLKPFFNHIIASDQIGVNKPAAKVFVESLNQAKATRKESLMIGDNLVADILGAKNCGIDQVFYNPQSTKHSENLTYEIQSLNELLAFL